MKNRILNTIAIPLLAVRHGLAVALGFLGETLSSMGSALNTASRKVDVF